MVASQGLTFQVTETFFFYSPLWGQCSSSEGRLKFMVTNKEISLPAGNLSHDLRIIQREQQISTRFYHYPFNQCSLPLCYEKKKLNIFEDRKMRLPRVAKSHLQCKALYCNQLSRKHPIQYLILFFCFFFLGKIKPVRVRPFYPLSFLLKHNPNNTELPVTRNSAVLHWRSFCLLL